MHLLSLNGGGSLGYIVVYLLEKLEEELNCSSSSLFDMIAGVSTGSIIGYGLSIGMPAKEIRKYYENFIPGIFKNKRGFFGSLFWSYYDIENLEKVVRDIYGVDNLSECKVPFMTYATKVSGKYIEPEFWKSWKSFDTKISDIISASCAAPLFFEPHKIGDDWYIDGGISSNSPNMSVITEVIKMGGDLDKIKLLNITPNAFRGFKKPKKELVGLFKVARNVTGVSLFGTEMDKNYQTKQLLGNRFLYINCDCGFMMDTTKIEDLKNFAELYWYANKHLMINHLTVER